MGLLAAAVAIAVKSYAPKGPRFSWDTLPVFFHSANTSGAVTPDGLALMARFPMVTIEKFQYNPEPTHQEARIIDVLKGVKLINPNVSTIFYYNSVLDFPMYDLATRMAADPSLMLRNGAGKIVKMSGGGHSDMDVFDFGNAAARALFIAECVNATRTGYVDGCFLDRCVDGTPTDAVSGPLAPCNSTSKCRYPLNLTDATARAYFAGHLQVIADLQRAIGDGPVIANHAFGPPHDAVERGAVSFAMNEFFKADNASINSLRWAAANGRGMQAHVGGTKPTIDLIAAFLVGAGRRAYFGNGKWSTTTTFFDHWSPMYELPLGAPSADAEYDALSHTWSRTFAHAGAVTFHVAKGTGTIEHWNAISFPSLY
jgi:hypothetical protein